MVFHILTIFPELFATDPISQKGGCCYFNESLFKSAVKKGLIKIKAVNLREFANDQHRKVDDRPFGGGPGMVYKIEPILAAIKSLKSQITNYKSQTNSKSKKDKKSKTRIILFSTRGKKLDSKTAKRLSKYDNLILICGRYEGVDERVAKYIADEEISIGDYILSGGELPAMVLIESVSRYLPGFLGKYESLEDIKGSYPTYTRPEIFELKKGKKGKKLRVPRVLLSGDHKKIEQWRRGNL